MALGCAYCRTRERLKEWILRLREVKRLRTEVRQASVDITAYRNLAKRYFEKADRGADVRPFDEVLRTEQTHLEIVQRGILK